MMQFFTKNHAEQKTTTMFKQYSQLSKEEIIQQLDSSVYGLQKDEVEDRLKKYGKNIFAHKRFVWYKKLMQNIFNPFIIILMIIVIYNFISYSIIDTGSDKNVDLYSAIIVLVMIILSVFISFFQDYRSYKSSEKLRRLIETTASVFRFTNKNQKIDFGALNSVTNFTKEVLIENLVPGDIIFLSSGDMIPADVRILVSVDLFINQSALTGETFPVEKHAINTKDDNKKSSILELENICFMGTSIVSGGGQLQLLLLQALILILVQLLVLLLVSAPLLVLVKVLKKFLTFLLVLCVSWYH